MRCCFGAPAKKPRNESSAEPTPSQHAPGRRLASIDEGSRETSEGSDGAVRHRMTSLDVVGPYSRPSMSIEAKKKMRRVKSVKASDPRDSSDIGTPTEEDIRRFYALYGPNGVTPIPPARPDAPTSNANGIAGFQLEARQKELQAAFERQEGYDEWRRS